MEVWEYWTSLWRSYLLPVRSCRPRGQVWTGLPTWSVEMTQRNMALFIFVRVPRLQASTTTALPTCCGSVSARGSLTVPTSSSCAEWRTPSVSRFRRSERRLPFGRRPHRAVAFADDALFTLTLVLLLVLALLLFFCVGCGAAVAVAGTAITSGFWYCIISSPDGVAQSRLDEQNSFQHSFPPNKLFSPACRTTYLRHSGQTSMCIPFFCVVIPHRIVTACSVAWADVQQSLVPWSHLARNCRLLL